MVMDKIPHRCKDCRAEYFAGKPVPKKARPAPHPGPRCVTHHRLHLRRQSELSHRRRTVSQYGLQPGEWDLLWKIQGEQCAGCGRKLTSGKRGATDHDHTCCNSKTSCGMCVRGILCPRCNDTLAHFRDDPQLLRRLATYLESPPAWQLPGHERYRH